MLPKDKIRTLVGEAKIREALALFYDAVPDDDSSQRNEIILLSNRYSQNEDEFRQKLINDNDYGVELSRITKAILSLINEYSEQSHHNPSRLDTAIAALPLSKDADLGLLQLLNCDRDTPMIQFNSNFKKKKDAHQPFQFYFLTGCPDEMPSSLAERILYELVEDESLEIQKSIDFPFNEHEGNRVKIENLPLNKKADVEKCKDKFKAYFQKRFHFADTDSFEQFIEQGLPLMPHKYVATVFSILETHWDYNESVLLEYLQWLMTTFNQVHQNVPTFIFLFVVHFPNIHDESKADEQHKAIVKKLEDLCTANTMALLREITPVEEKHVKDWFYELGINNPNKIQPVLSEFIKTLDKNDLLTIKNGHGFHMKDVEPLQEKVVQTFRARFKP